MAYVRNRNAQTNLCRYARRGVYNPRVDLGAYTQTSGHSSLHDPGQEPHEDNDKDIYAISVAYHSTEMDLFYMSRKSLRIRRGRGLLANDNPASTSPGRRIVGVFTLGTCAFPTA